MVAGIGLHVWGYEGWGRVEGRGEEKGVVSEVSWKGDLSNADGESVSEHRMEEKWVLGRLGLSGVRSGRASRCA